MSRVIVMDCTQIGLSRQAVRFGLSHSDPDLAVGQNNHP